MNTLSYNFRGLGKALAITRLTSLVRREALKVVFLMETKCDRKKMEEIRDRIGFMGCFVVDCVGRSGGLCLLWNEEVTVSIKSYTSHHIDVEIELSGEDFCWRFTGFYGWPRKDEKLNS